MKSKGNTTGLKEGKVGLEVWRGVGEATRHGVRIMECLQLSGRAGISMEHVGMTGSEDDSLTPKAPLGAAGGQGSSDRYHDISACMLACLERGNYARQLISDGWGSL